MYKSSDESFTSYNIPVLYASDIYMYTGRESFGSLIQVEKASEFVEKWKASIGRNKGRGGGGETTRGLNTPTGQTVNIQCLSIAERSREYLCKPGRT